MAKTKAPTPQEIYRQRRQREEKERTAYLPPGLINHGNTCFMNSVLQGLIATRLLADLVYFNPIPEEIQTTAATHIVSTRSPQLTNGHVFAGPYKQQYVDAMPIGDVFLNTVYRAWGAQAARRRDVLSPRNLLTTLGQKYDQYLDFAQQDAHEFLRILLDAMRMEEFDIIKKRQPPQPQKKRRRTTITPSIARKSHEPTIPDRSLRIDIADSPPGTHPTSVSSPNGSPSPNNALPLMSFVDMVFGGRLTSILVCQKCKRVSQTYEDFNDISLSIKPEDYFPHRKRDRLKKLVGRFAAFPGTSTPKDKASLPGSQIPLVPNHTVEMLRSASSPSTPNSEKEPKLPGGALEERSTETSKATNLEATSAHGETPLEQTKAIPVAETTREDDSEVANASDSSHVLVNVTGPEEKHVEFLEPRKEKDEKKEDSWVKIGRRISLNIGLGRPKDKEKEKEKEKKDRDRKARSMDRGFLSVAAIKEAVTPEMPSVQKSQSGPALPMLAPDVTVPKNRVSSDSAIRPSISSLANESPSSSSQKLSWPPPSLASLSTSSIPTSSSKRDPSSLQSTTTQATAPSATIPPSPQRSKSPKPPKPSSAEQEYLKKILADVAPPSSPFTIFRPPIPHRHTSDHTTSIPLTEKEKSASTAWLGLGARPFSGLEECLRLFTSVEVLDGENMVGCRRCWKIQNGTLHSSKREDSDGDDDDEEDDVPPLSGPTRVEGETQTQTTSPNPIPPSLSLGTASSSSPVQIHASHSTPTVSFYSHPNTQSVTSLPTSVSDVNLSSMKENHTPDGSPDSPLSLSVVSESSITTAQTSESEGGPGRGPGGLPIPVILTTTSETMDLSETTASTPNESSSESHYSSASEGPSVSSEALMMAAAVSAVNGRHLPNAKHLSYSKDSLVIPPRTRYGNRRAAPMDTSNTTDDGSSDDESDTSVGTSVSAESVNVPRTGGVNGSQASGQATSAPSTSKEPLKAQKKPSKPKPTLMRSAYKRYLIATPPPVLVIHLKRFQQTSKSSLMMSFSHGFKKLDDYISFPEYLDLSPFLAPRKEDYGLGKKRRKERAKKEKDGHHKQPKEERCMYRLYAVVVHIGNMLGGHYVAYTALPDHPPLHQSSCSSHSPSDATAVPSNSAAATSSAPEKSATATPHPDQEQPAERNWAYISDTTVRLTSLEEVLSSKAYLCMYERC